MRRGPVLRVGADVAVWHFRDSNDHEFDAVVAHGDGRWLAVEVKLGSGSG